MFLTFFGHKYTFLQWCFCLGWWWRCFCRPHDVLPNPNIWSISSFSSAQSRLRSASCKQPCTSLSCKCNCSLTHCRSCNCCVSARYWVFWSEQLARSTSRDFWALGLKTCDRLVMRSVPWLLWALQQGTWSQAERAIAVLRTEDFRGGETSSMSSLPASSASLLFILAWLLALPSKSESSRSCVPACSLMRFSISCAHVTWGGHFCQHQ